METDLNPISFGNLLKKYLTLHKISRASLARRLGMENSAISRYQKSDSVNFQIIAKLSHALKHNFFADLADLLPESYSKDKTKWMEKDARIAALEREIEILKAEKEVLLTAFRK